MLSVSDVSVQGCNLVGLVAAGCRTTLTGLSVQEDLEGLFCAGGRLYGACWSLPENCLRVHKTVMNQLEMTLGRCFALLLNGKARAHIWLEATLILSILF